MRKKKPKPILLNFKGTPTLFLSLQVNERTCSKVQGCFYVALKHYEIQNPCVYVVCAVFKIPAIVTGLDCLLLSVVLSKLYSHYVTVCHNSCPICRKRCALRDSGRFSLRDETRWNVAADPRGFWRRTLFWPAVFPVRPSWPVAFWSNPSRICQIVCGWNGDVGQRWSAFVDLAELNEAAPSTAASEMLEVIR